MVVVDDLVDDAGGIVRGGSTPSRLPALLPELIPSLTPLLEL